MASNEKVAVLNYGSENYSQEWKGDVYEIPAGKAVKMSRGDASKFLASMSPPDPQTKKPKFKKLKSIPLEEAESFIIREYSNKTKNQEQYVSNYDGKVFSSKEALDAHLESIKHLTTDPDKIVEKDPEPLQDPTGMVRCPFCGKDGIKGQAGLKIHMSQHCPAIKNPTTEEKARAKDKTDEKALKDKSDDNSVDYLFADS